MAGSFYVFILYALCMSNVLWLGKDMQKKKIFIFPTFHFPDFFQLKKICLCFFFIFPTFHFRFPDFLLPFSRLFTSGSKKSGKRK